jgi:Sec7-like guanine-nucleotide exchange factor
MYIKCVLKPIIARIKKLEQGPEKELSDQEAETDEINIEETKE